MSLHLARPLLTLEAAVSALSDAVRDSTDGTRSLPAEYAAEVAWGLIHGQLRGRIPYPVPVDLMAVAVALAIRWTHYLDKSDAVQINGSEVTALAQPQFTGFTLSELVVLWRYRVRTA